VALEEKLALAKDAVPKLKYSEMAKLAGEVRTYMVKG